MYSVFSYYLAKTTADLPFNIFFPILFSTIGYWMIGLRVDASAFFTFMGFIIMVLIPTKVKDYLLTMECFQISNISQSIGLLVSVALDLQVALGLFPVTVIPFLLVGGLFLNIDDIPGYFDEFQYMSFFFYTYTACKSPLHPQHPQHPQRPTLTYILHLCSVHK